MVLETTIKKEETEISFTDFDFQVLKICGTNVIQDKVPPNKPIISGLKFINNKILTNLDKIIYHLSIIKISPNLRLQISWFVHFYFSKSKNVLLLDIW